MIIKRIKKINTLLCLTLLSAVSVQAQPSAPDVVGMSLADAGIAITNATCTLGTVTETYTQGVISGTVLSQDPSAGQPAITVNLVIQEIAPTQTDAVWTATAGSNWTDSANWSSSEAPMRETQNQIVRFTGNTTECVLSTNATVAQLILGDGGPANVRLTYGAHLEAGHHPDGSTLWTAIGYDGDAALTIEPGAYFQTASNLYLGVDAGDSTLSLEGGDMDVIGIFRVGNSDTNGVKATGTVTITDGGELYVHSFDIHSNSVVNLLYGTITTDGDQTNELQALIDNGLIHCGSGTVFLSKVRSHTELIVTPDNELTPEYALSTIPPTLSIDGSTISYAYLQRSSDPSLYYTLESTFDLLDEWTPISVSGGRYSTSGASSTPGFDQTVVSFQITAPQMYIRVKVTR